MGFVVKTKVCL